MSREAINFTIFKLVSTFETAYLNVSIFSNVFSHFSMDDRGKHIKKYTVPNKNKISKI